MPQAEELASKLHIDEHSPYAIDIQGDFQFDSIAPPDQGVKRSDARNAKKAASAQKQKTAPISKEGSGRSRWKWGNRNTSPAADVPAGDDEKLTQNGEGKTPFALKDISLKIPRGEQQQYQALIWLSLTSKAHWSALLAGLGRGKRLYSSA